jgi:D-alanyl-D-alanine carboxypeptidase
MGRSDLSTGTEMSTDDKFRVGSNTKTFVVTVILQLVDEGKLSLDDTVASFDLGVTVPLGDQITVRQLCNMTSGLFEAYNAPQVAGTELNPLTIYDPAELVAFAAQNPSYFPPGQGWNYSNTNYILLGMIIEKLTGRPVADEVRDRLIVPMGLIHTTYPTVYCGMPCPYAHGYALDDAGDWQDVSVMFPPSLTGAAGAMISDMADMKKWVKAYVTGTTNSPATQKERLSVVETGKPGMEFGLGIAYSGGWWGYTGGMAGYNTAAYYLPEQDACIIAFVTTFPDGPAPGVANSIVRDIAKVVFPQNVPFDDGSGI